MEFIGLLVIAAVLVVVGFPIYTLMRFNQLSERVESLNQEVTRLRNTLIDQWNKQHAEDTVDDDITEEVTIAPTESLTETTPAEPIPAQPASTENTIFTEQPTIADKLFSLIKNYFTEGNLIVRVGIIVLFFGVAFLLKYASDNSLLPIELGMASVGTLGITLLILGWRLKSKQYTYALILQGGGIGILYITVFSALRLYTLLPAAAAFSFLITIVCLSAALAILQNARSLAILGVIGGFLAPILTSTGEGSHVALFSYYTILNIGILGIAWFKTWRLLNLIGFGFTFIIGTTWGITRYTPELFSSTEPFLITFFLLYVAIAILFAHRQAPALKTYVDGTLVFGTPITAFILQSALVSDIPQGLAWSAFALGSFYLLLSKILRQCKIENFRTLSEAFLALGVVFASLAIPFTLDGHWTAAAWSLEGAAILWVSIRQQQRLATAFALLLQLGAGMIFLFNHYPNSPWPVINAIFLGSTFISIAGLFSSYYIQSHFDETAKSRPWESYCHQPLLIWGLLWWFAAGINEIEHFIDHQYELNSIILFVAFSCAILGYLRVKLNWSVLQHTAKGLLIVLSIFTLISVNEGTHPFSELGYIAWPCSFIIFYWLLKQRDNETNTAYLHALGLWLVLILLTNETEWLVSTVTDARGSWAEATYALLPSIALLLLTKINVWPFHDQRKTYLSIAAIPIALYLCAWSVITNLSSAGDPWPLPFIPFLNPLDMMHAIMLVCLLIWYQALKQHKHNNNDKISPALFLYAGIIFVWLNAILLRSLHHWADIAFNFDSMMQSTLTQAALSIFWTLIGLSIMIIASRKTIRPLWISAACLLGATVIKLFTVDLADSATLESIVSFIVVGLLLLVVGYFAPIPPKKMQASP